MSGRQSGNRVEERKRGWRTGRGDRRYVYGPEESIKECKIGEKRAKKGGGRRGKRNSRNGKNDMRKQERDRRKVKKKNIPNVRLSRKQY